MCPRITEKNISFFCYTGLHQIDFLGFLFRTDVDAVVDEISRKEPLVTPSKTEQIRKLIIRLQEKQLQQDDSNFYLFKVRN